MEEPTGAWTLPFVSEFGRVLGGIADPASVRVRPVIRRITQQDGATFTYEVETFDSFARPKNVKRFSSLGHSRRDSAEYHDDLSKWVLGQMSRSTNLDTGNVESQTDFYAATALPQASYRFGKLIRRYDFHPDGTLKSLTDGRNNTTTLNSWKRGVSRSIVRPLGANMSAVVNDRGEITSVTDPNGFVTGYQYDLGGRVSLVTAPTGDSVAWASTTISTGPTSSGEMGLPAAIGEGQRLAAPIGR
ncbi:MAG: RHS repeat protein [Nitrospiraceae bacterium]|nr:RHS repeat protein [Nitrospiraceae bacterium]